MNRLGQFWRASTKVFALPQRLRVLRDHRVDPEIAPAVLFGTLLLGAVLRVRSFLQLQRESGRRGYQRLLQWPHAISDDALAYGVAHADLGQLRSLLVGVNQTLKQNKALEAAKIHGLLVVAIDANEQFASCARCCADCAQRQVTVDAWYTTGPFLRAVQKLGWGVVSVLKQERYEVYQETTALLPVQTVRHWQWQERHVDLWEVNHLTFTEAQGPVRVVVAEESWSEVKRLAGQKRVVAKQSSWRWVATRELDGYDATVIWRIGHQRWGVENYAFNELTQYYHLEHCPHHEPTAIVAWLLILVLGFVLFEWFARLHSKLWRAEQESLQEAARQLDLALARWEELTPLWSG